jgi:hypothetical protein
VRRARKLGVSLGEFIRRAMESLLEAGADAATDDPLLTDAATYDGQVPADLAARHDDYLYDRPPGRRK